MVSHIVIGANQDMLAIAGRELSAVLLAAYGPANPESDKILARVGIRVTNRVRQLSHQHGTGRIYRRGNVEHQASAPGEPFATDTGRLSASYNWQTGRDPQGPFVDIGTNVEYGPFDEFGTSRMAARPTLRPAVIAERDAIGQTIAEGLRSALTIEVEKHGGT